jgi:hypothetical protein
MRLMVETLSLTIARRSFVNLDKLFIFQEMMR